jgi:UDP-N-acetylmuramate dehydrogenase
MNNPGSDLIIYENAPLAPYSTLRVGGAARFLVKAKTEAEIIAGLQFARKQGCPAFILGGGSNIVVSGSGFPGLVLKIELSGIERLDRNGAEISVAAGEDWDGFVQYCTDRDLAGIECLSGIPGTVGGAPIQNVGAYGEEVSAAILKVRVLNRDTYAVSDLRNDQCGFAYRSSIFNTIDKERYVVLRVDFVLRPDGAPEIRYQDLQRHFTESRQIPSIKEVREAVLQIRDAKGMILREEAPDSKSAGSFFKNPILAIEEATMLEERARERGLLSASEQIPRFPDASGQQKVPAAWLIERAGFHRGYVHGRAGISGRHTLALINRGGADTEEIIDLMRLIQGRVRTLFGIELQPEPVFIGFY